MISADDVDRLRPEEKDCILDAMLGMAWSDGSVHLDELDLLRRLARHFTDKDVAELARDYKPDSERISRKIGQSDLGPLGKLV